MPKHNTWVIKLGGSLIGSRYLSAWLAAIAAVSRQNRVVIVPGGGVFADVVRSTQRELKFDDAVAHYMALQAMRQFGLALLALMQPWCSTSLMCTPSIKADQTTCGVCVWDPCDPALDGSQLPKDWRVTSDSLSLWLCGELGDTHLLLVKSTTPPSGSEDLSQLTAGNFIDAFFPVLRATVKEPGWWLESAHAGALASLIAGSPPQAQYIGRI